MLPEGLTADIKTASVERILYSSSNVSSVNKDAIIPKTSTDVINNNVTAATASTTAAADYLLPRKLTLSYSSEGSPALAVFSSHCL